MEVKVDFEGIDLINIKTREEKMMKECIAIHPGNRVAVDIPKTVSWSAAHPFQGGRVSPR